LRKGGTCAPQGGVFKRGATPCPPRLWDESKYGNKVEITANDVLFREGTMLVLVNFVKFFLVKNRKRNSQELTLWRGNKPD